MNVDIENKKRPIRGKNKDNGPGKSERKKERKKAREAIKTIKKMKREKKKKQ